MLRQNTGSVVCPNCGRLVGVRDAKCYQCGRPYPGLFGFAPWLNKLARDFGFAEVVIGGSVLMYVVSLALNPSAALEMRGLLSIFSPGGAEIFLLGSSGAAPIFGYGRWWTVLSASWLHGGLIHIAFNLYWVRNLAPQLAEVLGTGRTILIYTAASITGFLGTSLMALLPMPSFLRGAMFTLGASAAVCGLMGGILAYSRATGNRAAQSSVMQFGLFILIFGLVVPGIDNWAHIFGFLGGYGAAKLLRPLHDESPLHMLAGAVCLLLFAGAIVLSVVHGLPIYQGMKAGG
ncbi:MAG: rhomboid family intramembrane serine protease [Holophagales bacterium]|nr:rhomboid family intramembrane serine protease [Holophagales bacterium]